ncbi:MAG: HAD hydrolase family protein [Phycisphaerae bacterium]|nr:HAD hydrolase family protein [Phycisphaerae bacterium]
MIDIDIPSFGRVQVHHVVSDFTGTLSVDGTLVPGVAGAIHELARQVTFHVLTADTFGTAAQATQGLPIVFNKLSGPDEDRQKADYVGELGAEHVVALGNGNNDRAMLRLARVGVAVIEAEGASTEAVQAANLVVVGAAAAFGLLLEPRRLRAALRW